MSSSEAAAHDAESEKHFQQAFQSFAMALAFMEDEEARKAVVHMFLDLCVWHGQRQGLLPEGELELTFPLRKSFHQRLDFSLEAGVELDQLLDEFPGTDDEEEDA